jgi:hypothetical protein
LFFLSPWGCGHPSDFFWEKNWPFCSLFFRSPKQNGQGNF